MIACKHDDVGSYTFKQKPEHLTPASASRPPFVVASSSAARGFSFRLMMKRIPLTRGKFAIVDDDDFERLSRHKWLAGRQTQNREGYAKRGTTMNGKRKTVFMHHEVIGFPLPGFCIDHINGNKLDNRKGNLQFVTYSINSQRKKKRRGTRVSKYVGVYASYGWRQAEKRRAKDPTLENKCKKWQAMTRKDGKAYWAKGGFSDEAEAARARDRLVIELFGNQAYTNFPLSDYGIKGVGE